MTKKHRYDLLAGVGLMILVGAIIYLSVSDNITIAALLMGVGGALTVVGLLNWLLYKDSDDLPKDIVIAMEDERNTSIRGQAALKALLASSVAMVLSAVLFLLRNEFVPFIVVACNIIFLFAFFFYSFTAIDKKTQ